MTVIDLPRNMLINFPHLLADVNVVVLATEMTLASARDTIRILSLAQDQRRRTRSRSSSPTRCRPASPRSARPTSKPRSSARSTSSIPYDLKAAANAAKLGQTFADANRSSKAGLAIRELAERGDRAPSDERSGRSRRRQEVAARQVRLQVAAGEEGQEHRRRPRRDARAAGTSRRRDPRIRDDETRQARPMSILQLLLIAGGLMAVLVTRLLRDRRAVGRPRRASGGSRRCAIAIRKAPTTRSNRSSRRRSRRASRRASQVAGSSSRIEALALRLHRTGKGWTLHAVPLRLARASRWRSP